MKAEDVMLKAANTWMADTIDGTAMKELEGFQLDALRAACGGGRYTVIDHENGGTLATLTDVRPEGRFTERYVIPVGGERP